LIPAQKGEVNMKKIVEWIESGHFEARAERFLDYLERPANVMAIVAALIALVIVCEVLVREVAR